MNGISSPQKAPLGTVPYANLAQFTLSLIKSMLHSGYYVPDHPEAQKHLTDLHGEFTKLVKDRSELTYMVTMTGEERGIIIEGYDSAPLHLDQVMRTNMAELFIPKFLEFFDRWNLLSFSLKADISAEEFPSFIILMSQPPEGDQGTKEAGERLMQALLDHHILHISTVFNDDIVGKERRLPWRVKMALSRLRRDLRMLPLYKRATPEELQRIKLQIMDDVIRPVRASGFLKDFLINCDLIAADIAVMEESQIERGILGNLSEEMLVSTAWDLVKDLERLGKVQDKTLQEGSSEAKTRRLAILREVVERLCSMESALDHNLLESLLKQQVLSLEDLPPDVRRAVDTQQLAHTFMSRKDEYVEQLGRVEPDEAGRQLVNMVHRILPELIRRSEYQTVAKILQVVNEGRQAPRTCQILEELAEKISQAIASQGTIGQLLGDLHCQDNDRRDHVVEILAFIGDQAGPGLLEAYATSGNKSVRVSAFEAMRRIGTSVLHPFLEKLPDIEREWFVLNHILTALSDQKEVSLAQPISRFLHHDNVHVRHAALTALFKLLGPAAEDYLLQALSDPEGEVHLMAVAYLGRVKSRHPQALEAYARALHADDLSAPPQNEAALIQVCHALASFEGQAAADTSKAETILLAALRPVEQKGALGWFKKPSHRHSERVRAAICEALAAVGSSASIASLR